MATNRTLPPVPLQTQVRRTAPGHADEEARQGGGAETAEAVQEEEQRSVPARQTEGEKQARHERRVPVLELGKGEAPPLCLLAEPVDHQSHHEHPEQAEMRKSAERAIASREGRPVPVAVRTSRVNA